MQLAVEAKTPELQSAPDGKAASAEVPQGAAQDVQPLTSHWSFATLLHPIPVQQFCEAHWARRPLHIARDRADFYRDLFSLAELERYLSLDGIFQIHSVATPSREYGLPDPPPASVSEVYERLLNGSSLRLRQMERYLHPTSPLVSLLRNMEVLLRHPCDSLSCYVSAPEGRGLGAHHDETEIFTLQISGTKRWRIYHRVDSDEAGLHEPENLGEPAEDIVLKPGDLFYLPAGYIHDVTTTGEPSFSLTIVFSPFRWRALLDLLAARLARTSAFLAPLPAGTSLLEQESATFQLAFESRLELIREELSQLSAEQLRGELGDRLARGATLPPDPQLENLFSLGAMSLDTRLEKRPDIVCQLTRTSGKVRLTLPGGYLVEASARAENALRHVLAADGPFRVSEMHASLSDGAKLALAKKLVASGLLSLVTVRPEQD